MSFFLAETVPDVQQIDLLSKSKQIFQGEIPDVSWSFSDTISPKSIVVIPHDAQHWTKPYQKYVSEVSKRYTTLVFNRGDKPRRLFESKNLISMQVAIPRMTRCSVILCPPNISPSKTLLFRNLQKDPIIGFVGHIPDLTLKTIFKSFVYNPNRPIRSNGPLLRNFGLSAMRKSQFKTNVIVRAHYGGAQSLIKNPEAFRQEFVENISESDLLLCPRGDANYSQRFFEVLSAGRIPIVPNTHMLIPYYPSSVKLTSILVKASCRDFDSKIKDFWSSMSCPLYLKAQITNREIYNQYFDYRVFMKRFFGVSNLGTRQSNFHRNRLLT